MLLEVTLWGAAVCLAPEAAPVSDPEAAEPSFGAIVAGVGARPDDESCALMEAWVARHPGTDEAARGLLWMAQLRIAAHEPERARGYFERVAREQPASPWAAHADKGLADLDLGTHDFAEAIDLYERLASQGPAELQGVARAAATAARGSRWRWDLYIVLAAALVASSAARLVRARVRDPRALWPVPEEVWSVAPLAGILAVAAWAQPADEARAVVGLALGAVVLTWIDCVAWRARAPRGWARVGEGALVVGQVASLLYCVLVRFDLWDKLVMTLALGSE